MLAGVVGLAETAPLWQRSQTLESFLGLLPLGIERERLAKVRDRLLTPAKRLENGSPHHERCDMGGPQFERLLSIGKALRRFTGAEIGRCSITVSVGEIGVYLDRFV